MISVGKLSVSREWFATPSLDVILPGLTPLLLYTNFGYRLQPLYARLHYPRL